MKKIFFAVSLMALASLADPPPNYLGPSRPREVRVEMHYGHAGYHHLSPVSGYDGWHHMSGRYYYGPHSGYYWDPVGAVWLPLAAGAVIGGTVALAAGGCCG